jgi:hypothetical protein
MRFLLLLLAIEKLQKPLRVGAHLWYDGNRAVNLVGHTEEEGRLHCCLRSSREQNPFLDYVGRRV